MCREAQTVCRPDARRWASAAVAALLMLAVPGSALAVPVSAWELTATITDFHGAPISVTRSAGDGGDADLSVVASADAGHATASLSHAREPLERYVAGFSPDMDREISVLGDTRWIAKLGYEVSIGPDPFNSLQTSLGGIQSQWRAQARLNERYAVFAIAPGSASGFAPLDTVDMRVFVQFYSDVQPLDLPLDFVPPFSTGPFLDFTGEFHDVIAALNVGHFLAIDLDAAGVSPGASYGFIEAYGFRETAPSDHVFLTIDPAIGVSFAVAEPATVVLGTLGVVGCLAARHRRAGTSDVRVACA